MRYWKGSIALSPTQDYPLLRQVLRSTFVTHRQLYDFLKLDFHAHSRNAFNNRVLRLVNHKYLVRDEIPYRTEGYVYSISDKGAAEMIGLGEYFIGACFSSQRWTTAQRCFPRNRAQRDSSGAQTLATTGALDAGNGDPF